MIWVIWDFLQLYSMHRAACEASCKKIGATLPVIRSVEENTEVKKYVPSTSK